MKKINPQKRGGKEAKKGERGLTAQVSANQVPKQRHQKTKKRTQVPGNSNWQKAPM